MNSSTFLNFIWGQQQNRKALFLAVGISVVFFIIFKILYPYPDFFSDSYSYIYAASANIDINIWPIGYSKFLAIIHAIAYYDTILVGIQYFLLLAALIFIYFTVLYFYEVSNFTRKALFIFFFVNPLSLYLCNTINSDALFAALSIFWIGQLIWIIYRPHICQLFIQAVLLFLCFTIRNNAYYYPLIALVAYFLSGFNWKVKIAGVLLPFVLIIPFILHTQNEALKITGTRQFSLFTGWQLANNALYIYDKIDVDSADLPTPQSQELNRLATAFVKYYDNPGYRDFLDSYVGNFFIRDPRAPLKHYYSKHYRHAKTEGELIANWGKASADFEPFGKYILLHNPIAYAKYFMWPNTFHYFMPPLSHIEVYNYGQNEIEPIAQQWFHYREPKIHCFSNKFQGFLIIYAALFLVLNLFYFVRFGQYLVKNHTLPITEMQATYLLIGCFVLVNLGFSIFSTLNILRYQVTPMLFLATYYFLINDYLNQTEKAKAVKRGTAIQNVNQSTSLVNDFSN